MTKPLIWYYRRGIIIGAIIGAIGAWIMIRQGAANLHDVFNMGKSVVDSLFARSSPAQLEIGKIYALFMTLGAMFGFITEWIMIHWFKR